MGCIGRVRLQCPSWKEGESRQMPIRFCYSGIGGGVIPRKEEQGSARFEQQHGHILQVSRECG